ncbi:hypothetical protein IQ06DRAFT_345887 [Phaeosphaeriaceae sp. SRC1lsM3a]|nr:hypothetical protein IQ06DRAFT_345887 [Stagonospora sp. SRC1lsM3a]
MANPVIAASRAYLAIPWNNVANSHPTDCWGRRPKCVQCGETETNAPFRDEDGVVTEWRDCAACTNHALRHNNVLPDISQPLPDGTYHLKMYFYTVGIKCENCIKADDEERRDRSRKYYKQRKDEDKETSEGKARAYLMRKRSQASGNVAGGNYQGQYQFSAAEMRIFRGMMQLGFERRRETAKKSTPNAEGKHVTNVASKAAPHFRTTRPSESFKKFGGTSANSASQRKVADPGEKKQKVGNAAQGTPAPSKTFRSTTPINSNESIKSGRVFSKPLGNATEKSATPRKPPGSVMSSASSNTSRSAGLGSTTGKTVVAAKPASTTRKAGSSSTARKNTSSSTMQKTGSSSTTAKVATAVKASKTTQANGAQAKTMKSAGTMQKKGSPSTTAKVVPPVQSAAPVVVNKKKKTTVPVVPVQNTSSLVRPKKKK